MFARFGAFDFSRGEFAQHVGSRSSPQVSPQKYTTWGRRKWTMTINRGIIVPYLLAFMNHQRTSAHAKNQ
jgi:hypothetical protein